MQPSVPSWLSRLPQLIRPLRHFADHHHHHHLNVRPNTSHSHLGTHHHHLGRHTTKCSHHTAPLKTPLVATTITTTTPQATTTTTTLTHHLRDAAQNTSFPSLGSTPQSSRQSRRASGDSILADCKPCSGWCFSQFQGEAPKARHC